jgi:hypothetical protein
MRAIHAAMLAAVASVLAGGLTDGAALRALLIAGESAEPNAPPPAAFKAILEANGLFQVDVVSTPSKGPNAGVFQASFDRYRLVVLNYAGDGWPVNSMAALDKYLNAGGGLVILPPASAAFPTWPEYNLMIGISAGSNRAASAGPLWFYQNGNFGYDAGFTGPAGKTPHPDQPFPVTIRYTEHPITKGLPLTWMHATDRLLGNLRGPGKNMTLLATAFSDPERGGTGRDEPQILTLSYGKGRVFHTLLGSLASGADCVGFQVLLQRGAEWAATGKVSQKVPADFPGEDKISARATKLDSK